MIARALDIECDDKIPLSFGYRFAHFDLTMADTSISNYRVCTKAGQLQPGVKKLL